MHHLPFLRATLRLLLAALLGAAVLCGSLSRAWAGGGPENLLLVVNPESPASLAIANHYAALRGVPASNILFLPWDPKLQSTDVDTFREKILAPIFAAAKRLPAGQISYVVYSSDFPWSIDAQADVKRFEAEANKALAENRAAEGEKAGTPAKPMPVWPKHLSPIGSLTGLTYLAEGVMTKHPLTYLQLRSNTYFRRDVPEQKGAATLGFKSTDGFGPQGELLKSNGRYFLLSTMLGVTSGRGNSVEEVLAYLRRAAAADGTRPKGTIYYVQNSDIRSKVRQDDFPAAVRELKALGVAAEIVQGATPMDKSDVQGAMLGIADFDWKASRSTILPGAICEHFTSFGGIMSRGAGQTPLSEFLRHGAAGASGTVTEPFAIAEKFPTAMLQVHYARGCTLAEAFYQSIFGPYQLLIVGDPQCRPWANIPRVTISGIEANANVKGTLRLKPAAQFPRPSKVDHFELFVNGLRWRQCGPEGILELDTEKLADGHHELRVVAVEAGLIGTQGAAIVPFVSNNRGHKIEVAWGAKTTLRMDQTLQLAVRAPGSEAVGVAQSSRWLAKAAGPEARLEIKASQLGAGPVRLQAIGAGTSPTPWKVLSEPIEITVEPGGQG